MVVSHYTKNNFEGVACAILLRFALDTDIEINTLEFNQLHELNIIYSQRTSAASILLLGATPIISNNFNDLYDKLENLFTEQFDNQTLKLFKEHVLAYLDWSWSKRKLFFGKNIDELCKMLGKETIINNIANRIANKEYIISEDEKSLLRIEKARVSEYVEKRKTIKREINGLKVVVVYAEIYKIEVANTMLSEKKGNDVVFVVDINDGQVFVKYNINKKTQHIKKNLEDMGAILSRAGVANIDIGTAFDNTIVTALTAKL